MAGEEERKKAGKREQNVSEKTVNLCLRRGIILPSSEIYGPQGGFFDYGPIGVEIKRNLEAIWWKFFVRDREDIVGMDSSQIAPAKVWEASGHVSSFNDPLVECSKCKKRFRADQLIEGALKINVDGMPLDKVQILMKEHKIVCPNDKGELSQIKPFNLMFKTHVGPLEDDGSVAYLRPETAQMIFVDFKNVQAASRKQLPFGIAQVGKAFRNEISPRNFVFRCREFSQMEIEYFIHPQKLNDCHYIQSVMDVVLPVCTAEMQAQGRNDEVKSVTVKESLQNKIIGTQWHAYWMATCMEFFLSLGIKSENLRLRQHTKDELSHYSSETWDIEYRYPWGWKELMGIANRTDFDLKQHMKFSGKDLSLFDDERNERVIPHVIEPSFGLDRLLFTILMDAYSEKREEGETKIVLRLHPSIAPAKAAIFPLMKKDGLREKAREVYMALRTKIVCEYDEAGSIGKRYARSDEIGIPYCITIDYETLKDDTVTIRDRDTTKQERVKIDEILNKIRT
ncbi:MAG: glycine--tRNA ligase [Candidatus Micrarchaeia archaeon]